MKSIKLIITCPDCGLRWYETDETDNHHCDCGYDLNLIDKSRLGLIVVTEEE